MMKILFKVLRTAAFIICLPILLPAAAFIIYWDGRKVRKLVKITTCQKCGRTLGREAQRLADSEWSEKVRVFGVRLEQTVHAICPHCATRYTFREKLNELRISPE